MSEFVQIRCPRCGKHLVRASKGSRIHKYCPRCGLEVHASV